MAVKEAKARIKINKLLEESGWRFFDDEIGEANIQLEPNVKIKEKDIDIFGEDFESVKNGYVDFLLLDDRGFPLVVLEAKNGDRNPLDGKEQARRYARSLNVRFVILSNGDLHYFWDLEYGNPDIITEFPTLESLNHKKTFIPDNIRLYDENVDKDYVAITQKPDFKDNPLFNNEETRDKFIFDEGIRILRPYQVKAVKALQKSAKKGNNRFLFEMATGTGKTLVSAAVIKLFLKTGNAKRILFLVDRLELEDQAFKNFVRYLKNDYTSVIYKQNKDDWKKAEIVVSTIQSFSSQDKYKRYFSPADFDLVISDEAHRSIGGNSRAVFEYFIGYKLGLTATPKNYLKNTHKDDFYVRDPRDWERRQLLDTYKTFGCERGEPTFRYSLLDGVNEGYLINPVVVDARTEITAEMLSEKGYAVFNVDDDGNETEENYFGRDFEKKFFSENTNYVFCKTFLENALRDPISGEVGKSIIFCVSQDHAAKITEILNKMAYKLWPDKYNSDFALQITSRIPNAQQYTVNFSNNNLNSHTRFLENYKSSKTRVCVTVGMMTTGYDCQDILNLALMRPVFSPSDFIQIKGRGTRKYTFIYQDVFSERHEDKKRKYKFFDFFANCEYFEEKYDYDEELKLPSISSGNTFDGEGITYDDVEIDDPDFIKILDEIPIGKEGMRIDREFFEKAKESIQKDSEIKEAVDFGQWERAVGILRDRYENKPELNLTLEKIRKSQNLDRRVTWREVLERVFGQIESFKSKDEMLEDECDKFISIYKPESNYISDIKNYLKTYVSDEKFRMIINDKRYGDLAFYPSFTKAELKSLNGWRDIIPEYARDYISFNTYTL